MQLTTGQAHDLFVALAMIERDDKLKFSGETWLKLAQNKNLLEPAALAYERARTKVLGNLHKANRALDEKVRRTDTEVESDFIDENGKLRDADLGDIALKILSRPDLKLDENGRTSGMLARLLPIVDKLEG